MVIHNLFYMKGDPLFSIFIADKKEKVLNYISVD